MNGNAWLTDLRLAARNLLRNRRRSLATFLALVIGTTLLIAMGAGIVLFALYSFSEAIWRRINLHASI